MTGPAVPVTEDGQEPGSRRPAGGSGIGRAAALIAGLTVVARLLGLVRTVVFAKTVGATCLGTAYVTANTLPNIVYDIVLGGALTSIMVPVLARPAQWSGQDRAAAAEVTQTSSALLTWTTLILVPVSVAVAVASGPLANLLNPANHGNHCARGQLVTVTGHMLAVFAPQIVLYGLAVVLYGILQAHRRFGAPAVAPVISSLVVIAAYLVFVPAGRADVNNLARLPLSAELILSVGTTAGVAALLLTALVPAWRLRLRVRPVLRFPPGIARRAGGLAVFGIIALVAQDASQLVVIRLANGYGSNAALVLYQYGWQVFEAAYAVLAISVAVSAFPALSVHEGEQFDRTAAGSLRTVLLTSFLGTALVLAIALLGRALPRLPARPGSAAGSGPGTVRARPGRVRAGGLPVPGAAGDTPHQDSGDRGGRRLADRDRRRRRASAGRARYSGGRRARAGQHHRPDRGRARPAGGSLARPRPGRAGGRRARRCGRTRSRDRGRRGGRWSCRGAAVGEPAR